MISERPTSPSIGAAATGAGREPRAPAAAVAGARAGDAFALRRLDHPARPVVLALVCVVAGLIVWLTGVAAAAPVLAVTIPTALLPIAWLAGRHSEVVEAGAEVAAARRRIIELELASRDLASFSYAVAHDLRAPLRTVHGFAELLLEDHAAELGQPALSYLRLVERGATDMGRLIDDLLAYARTGQVAIERAPVDPGAIAREALARIAGDRPLDDVRLVIADDLPGCSADPRLLRFVYQNLLSNALKFTAGRDDRRIDVGWRRDGGGEVVYFVSDNGVGFDPRYAGRLFGLFERFHPGEDFDGTGLGLPMVERIVHRHGGRVWGDGEIDRGATISFTIGADDRREPTDDERMRDEVTRLAAAGAQSPTARRPAARAPR
ncbi:MAG: ATP-binding protein [Solirubrobacteraceae bacterium]|nr:ATP-binding protein [Solirubrobacteraceae bacterium]